MKSAGLDHRLIRDYLRELDAAMATLPTPQARELRQQITAHLDEVLQPGADDDGVAAALGRLGAPADLAAEVGAAIPVPLSAAIKVTARARLARVSRQMWIRLGAAVIVIGIVAGYLVFYLAAGSLVEGPQSLWWYPRTPPAQCLPPRTARPRPRCRSARGSARVSRSAFTIPPT